MADWMGRFALTTKTMAVVAVLALVSVLIAAVGASSLNRMTDAA